MFFTLSWARDFLGQKGIRNTEICLHFESTMFGESRDDESTVKVAEKSDEVKALVELVLNTPAKKIA